eukprot:g37510.t1
MLLKLPSQAPFSWLRFAQFAGRPVHRVRCVRAEPAQLPFPALSVSRHNQPIVAQRVHRVPHLCCVRVATPPYIKHERDGMAGIWSLTFEDDDHHDLPVEFEEGEGCPKCGTTLLQMPTLELRYSSCCGRMLCTSCINSTFKATRKGDVFDCDQCRQKIRKSSFLMQNLHSQQFTREHKTRERLNRIYNMERQDFDTDMEYENYVEQKESLVFDILHGNAEEQKIANKVVEDHKQQHQHEIERRRIRKTQIQQETNKPQPDQPEPAPPPIQPAAPWQTPQLQQGGAPLPIKPAMDKSEHKEPQLKESQRQKAFRLQAMAQVMETIQNVATPGGFFPDYYRRRLREEGMDSLALML